MCLKILRKNNTVSYSGLLNYGLICKICPNTIVLNKKMSIFLLTWLEWNQKIPQKLTFVPFCYIRIYSRIFSSLKHKIRELMPSKRRENLPNCYILRFAKTGLLGPGLNYGLICKTSSSTVVLNRKNFIFLPFLLDLPGNRRTKRRVQKFHKRTLTLWPGRLLLWKDVFCISGFHL